MSRILPSDSEVFLLSFAQLDYALAIDPLQQEYVQARLDIVARLSRELGITELQLLARSQDTYTVAYKQGGESRLIEFPFEEIEDFV
ncbi:MAG: hypothetical protein OWT28_01105 [Firmicutes bacterium]|nr:hypothetical protein [Bacillota bacterium]